jgi:hypothetical protein
MTMQVLRHEAKIKLDKWAVKSEKLLPQLDWHATPPSGSWEEVIAKNHYLVAYTNRPYYVLQYGYEIAEHPEPEAQRESHLRFRLAASIHESQKHLTFNGSREWPDFFWRNMGVSYSQLIHREESEEGQAASKQRAAQAFLTYLKHGTLAVEDRETVEQGLLTLLAPPPPGLEGLREMAMRREAQARAQAQAQAQAQAAKPKGKKTGKKKR